MSDWLSEIEDFIEREILLGQEEGERMARVIRELAIYIIYLEVGATSIYTARSDYLSPDAKELLE